MKEETKKVVKGCFTWFFLLLTVFAFLQYSNVLVLPKFLVKTEIVINYAISSYGLLLSVLGGCAIILDFTHEQNRYGYCRPWYAGSAESLKKASFKKPSDFMKRMGTANRCFTVLVLFFGFLNGKIDAMYISYLVSFCFSWVIRLMYMIICIVFKVNAMDSLLSGITDSRYMDIKREYLAIKDSLIMDGALSTKEGKKELRKMAREYYNLIC